MIPLQTYNPTDPDDEHYSEDFTQMIKEDFTEPLKKLGFTPIGMITTHDENDCGAHIITYKHDGTSELRNDWIKTITDTEEEGFMSKGILY